MHNLPNRFLSLSDFQQVHHGPFYEINKSAQSHPWVDKVIKDSFQLKLGKGTIIRFWEDQWIHPEPLRLSFPRLYSISQQQTFPVCYMEVWDGESWLWNFTWRRSLYQWEEDILRQLMIKLVSNKPTLNSNDNDSLTWTPDLVADYAISSFVQQASHQLYSTNLNAEVIKFIWSKKAPLRAELLTWFLVKGKLKTNNLLLNLGVI